MKNILILTFTVLTALPAFGQGNYAYLAWDYNYPLSNKEWLSTSSPHGGVLGFRYFIRDGQMSVGLDVNWTTYDQYEPPFTFPQENGAITTDYYKYIYQYGAVANVQFYYPIQSEIVFPYYGVGLGAVYNKYTLYYNIYEDNSKAWGFLARPEVGVLVKFGEDRALGAIAGVHYDYSTSKNENYNYSGFSSLGWKIGIVLMSRD